MAPITMSVHEALNRLKITGKRLETATAQHFIATAQNGKTIGSNPTDVATFIAQVSANHARVVALIENYNRLKQAIVESNARTTLRIGTRDMSIAALIEYRKHSQVYYKAWLTQLVAQRRSALAVISKDQATLTERAEKAAAIAFAGSVTQKGGAEWLQFCETYTKNNAIAVVDPINIDAVIEKVTTEMETIERDLDVLLTASNVTTRITIDLDQE